jgi:hypothetical protein
MRSASPFAQSFLAIHIQRINFDGALRSRRHVLMISSSSRKSGKSLPRAQYEES